MYVLHCFQMKTQRTSRSDVELATKRFDGLKHRMEMSRLTIPGRQSTGVTQARVSDLKRGKINRFSMDLLVRLAARA
jgi:Helix-turn-helix domain